jgi:DNA adenine methylase
MTTDGTPAPCAPVFLNWAGGKRGLLAQILPHLPASYGRYFEPFLGGGSLFFSLKPKRAFLADINTPLIDAYIEVRRDVRTVIRHLSRFHFSQVAYYHVRDSSPRGSAARAARFIYLNKTCWNGLYRENLAGRFNVPFGRKKTPFVPDVHALHNASHLLRSATLSSADFATATQAVKPGDLVFLDPPYVTTHDNNGFIEYNARLFTWSDQERLAAHARALAKRGAFVAVTNAAHSDVVRLYRGFHNVALHRHSTIAGAPAARRPVKEILFTAWS